MEAEVGSFDADLLVKTLKKAHLAKRTPVEGLRPEFPAKIFQNVTDNPNQWLRTISSDFESLNCKMIAMSHHIGILARSLDRTIQLLSRREKV